jgi:hypothetical protein
LADFHQLNASAIEPLARADELLADGGFCSQQGLSAKMKAPPSQTGRADGG